MTTERILLIDDDRELCTLLTEYLMTEGFRVEAVHDGSEGLGRALSDPFCMVVLDVMLPGLNGLDVLREIRKGSEVPVLMLTARGEEVDRIVGLEIGADDYLSKPFNPRELVARIRSILRRTSPPVAAGGGHRESGTVRVGQFRLDTVSRSLSWKGEEIYLTGVEFKVLQRLIAARGEVLSRESLCREALGREYSPLDRSLDVHISNLRKKLGDTQGRAQCIKAIRGEGYLFVAHES